jgi:hypothetical protein
VTDAYKLGLAVLRCLAPGPGAASSRSAGRLAGAIDPVGAGLVSRALSADRGQRPTARDWHGYLSWVVASRRAIPEVVTVSLGDWARPQVPALGVLPLDSVLTALAWRPAIRVPDLPAVPSPHVPGLVEILKPDRTTAMTLPRLDGVIARSSGAVAEAVLSEGNRYLAALRRTKLGGRDDQAHG